MTQTLLQVLQKQPFVEVFRPEHTQKLATLAPVGAFRSPTR